jgi:formate/nitrite transporter FocA (FNT family)
LPRTNPATQPAAARAKAQARGRKEYPEIMRYLVLAVFALILFSLASGLYFVFHDRGASKRAVKALALRVGLSVGLFVLLMVAYYFGFVPARL